VRIITGVLCAAVGAWMLAGCQAGKRELLSIDFKQGQVLRYKQVSERDIELNFDPSGKFSKDEGRIQKMKEGLELVTAYKPVKVDENGFSTIEATFEEVKVSRTMLSPHAATRDAVDHLKGKTVTFTMTPSGIITDYSNLDALVKRLGEEAFGGKTKGIKDPDMIEDFMTLEWMMWDSISSIKKPAQGVAVGQKWESQLMAPMPMPIRVFRATTYELKNVENINGKPIAVIDSTYKLDGNAAANWPVPYTGAFQMRGTFGFLRGYKVLSLSGSGTERFDIDAGRVEQINQQYESSISAEMPFALGTPETTPSPNLIIRQKLTAQLLEK
jgi:hypothetical protein